MCFSAVRYLLPSPCDRARAIHRRRSAAPTRSRRLRAWRRARLLPRQIVLLGAVGLDVEKLPGLSVTEDQLPFAVAHRFVALPLPEDWLCPFKRLSKEGRSQADTLHRFDGMAAKFARVCRTGETDGGRHDVDQVYWLFLQGPVRSAGMAAGQWAMSGVLMPPSWVKCL